MSALLTEHDVAEQFGIGVSTIQRWRRNGDGPQYLNLGKNTIRYSQADIDAYKNRRATGGEIPARAIHAMSRALGALGMVAGWKISDPARATIESIRDELRSLIGGE